MARALLTLASFGFAASAGVAALVLPHASAAVAIGALLLAFITLQHLRDDEVAADAIRAQTSGDGR